MSKKVYISAVNVKTTDISCLDDLQSFILNDEQIQLEEINVSKENIFLGEKIKMDSSSEFYPSKSNEKVMRAEVIASAICVGDILKSLNIPEHELLNIPLYISSGNFFERQEGDMDWFSKVIDASFTLDKIEEKNKRFNQLVPPLISLRTLTNSASSFVAQICKLAGNNTTFGNTSQSAFWALKQAFQNIQYGKSEYSVVGGANRGGLSSYFMFKGFTNSNTKWKELACASFLVLESEESLRKNNRIPLCELTVFNSTENIPDLITSQKEPAFHEFKSISSESDLCVFGGAFRNSDYLEDKKNADLIWKNTYSLFPNIGNFGAAGLFMNIATAIVFFKEEKYKTIDCADRDAYKRDSMVRLKNIY